MPPLRFLTYLAPGIPRAFFAFTVESVARRTGIEAVLKVETDEPARARALATFGFSRFVPVDRAFYAGFPILEDWLGA